MKARITPKAAVAAVSRTTDNAARATPKKQKQRLAALGHARPTPALNPPSALQPETSQPPTKRERTRARLLGAALAVFTSHGVERATMREIARAAGLSLGAAYYYFPSKEALILAYYAETQANVDALAVGLVGTTRERLGELFHARVRVVAPQRLMLGSALGRLITWDDPISAFAAASVDLRRRNLDALATALAPSQLPSTLVPSICYGLWLAQLATLWVLVNDASAAQTRTHDLIDKLLDLIVPMLPLLASPLGHTLIVRISDILQAALPHPDAPLPPAPHARGSDEPAPRSARGLAKR